MVKRHVLERTQRLATPRREIFAFFSEIHNLQRLTPPFLDFEIVTKEKVPMRVGARIEYRIRLMGLPMAWLTEITEFVPEQRFVDTQLRGPYRVWEHLHEFVELPDGTLMRDRVEYELPFGPAGEAAHALFIRRTLQRIFDYRAQASAGLFGALPNSA